MLKTKSILEPQDESDGLRISVMASPFNYHVLNDGITPDERITKSNYDDWHKTLAPPLKLLGDYYKKGASLSQSEKWDLLKKGYLEHIRKPEVQIKVQNLAHRSLDSTITLLCIEESPEYCHRRLLAEECKKYQPSLVLNIR